MNKPMIALITASAFAFASTSAFAQYTGPGSAPTVTDVASINANPVDDTQVELIGYLIEKVDDETYLFSDGKETIEVEIDSEDMPPVAINDKTKVQIVGEVEAGAFERTEIEVDRITVM